MSVSRSTQIRQEKNIVVIALILILVAVGVFAFYNIKTKKTQDTSLPDTAPLSVSFGDLSSSKKVVIYIDPVCDKCAAYHRETISRVYEDYVKPGKVILEIRPLSIVTEQSAALTELMMCSNEQGKFLEASDFIYQTLTRDNGRTMQVNAATFFHDYPTDRIAVGTKTDTTKLASCLRDNRYENKITQADSQAYAANIYSTPTTFIGGQDPVRGYAIYDYVRSLIDITL